MYWWQKWKPLVPNSDCKEPLGKVTEAGTYNRRLGSHAQLASTTGQILAHLVGSTGERLKRNSTGLPAAQDTPEQM